jgi:large subunit ribosomal protein L30
LKKINQVVERPDTPAFRGMVKKIPHLLELAQGEVRVKGARGSAK